MYICRLDVQLTRESGFLDAFRGQNISGMSVMADRGFTEIGATLNIPPFLDGRQQMSPDDVKTGRGITSLRIHVERVIGRVKNYSILKGVLPLQIVYVCAFLVNFQPVLLPPPFEQEPEQDVEKYFALYDDSDCEYDADTECSNEEV